MQGVIRLENAEVIEQDLETLMKQQHKLEEKRDIAAALMDLMEVAEVIILIQDFVQLIYPQNQNIHLDLHPIVFEAEELEI